MSEIHVYGFCEDKCRREVMLKTDLEAKFTEIDTSLSGKASAAEVTEELSGKSDTEHNHDDRYYTETEVNNLLADKAAANHTHGSMSTITFAAAEPTSVAAGEIVMVYEE